MTPFQVTPLKDGAANIRFNSHHWASSSVGMDDERRQYRRVASRVFSVADTLSVVRRGLYMDTPGVEDL